MVSMMTFFVRGLQVFAVLTVSVGIKSQGRLNCVTNREEEGLFPPGFTFEGYDGENCTIHELDEQSWTECHKKGYAMKCSDLRLRKIPKTYPALISPQPRMTPPLALLDLSLNSFENIPNSSFVHAIHMNSSDIRFLYLQKCCIRFIHSNAFINLTNLLYLNLIGNYLTWPDGFGEGVFKPLVNVKDINLHHNEIKSFKDLGYEMQYMRQLRGLFITLCSGCKFGPGFSNLTSLRNISLSGAHDGSCDVATIPNDTFKYVTTIQHLFICSCGIRVIEKNAFAPLKSLIHLDMSYNRDLGFEGMNAALYGLRNSSRLKILYVNKIYRTFGLGVEVKAEHLTYLKTLQSLRELHMDLNKIEIFEERVLFPDVLFPKSLRKLTLAGNRLTEGNYTRHIHALKSIHVLDISRQFLHRDPFYHEHFGVESRFNRTSVSRTSRCNCTVINVLCLPENIKYISWKNSLIELELDLSKPWLPFLTICGADYLKGLDLSDNLISSWNTYIYGLGGITFLDLSFNRCGSVSKSFFDSFKNLKYLNVSGNYLGSAFSNLSPSELSALFQNLTNLKELNMSFNIIQYLHEDMFKNLKNIERLSLRVNLLKSWSYTLESRSLRLLDLAYNKLNVLDEPLLRYLDSVVAETGKVIVNLTGNPLDCSCSHLYFLRWLKTSVVDVSLPGSECSIEGTRYPLTSIPDLDLLVNRLENDICKDKSWITWTCTLASTLGTGILSGFCCFIVYKHRWKLRYMYYTRHRRHTLEGYDRLFQFDAFISYAKTLGRFMKDSAVPALQDVHKLTTWVYDKDSVPGASMAENIMHAISNSKKVVLFVNGDFLSDTWCEYETNMALVESVATKRKIFIIVLLQKMAMKDLPIYIQKLLKSESSLDYPDNEADRTRFWMNLAEEIKS